MNLSVFRLPHKVVFPVTSFFAALTAHWALPLELGYQADDSLTFNPHPLNHVFISWEVRLVPLSQLCSSGTSILENSCMSIAISSEEVLLPGGNQAVLFHPKLWSTYMRYW